MLSGVSGIRSDLSGIANGDPGTSGSATPTTGILLEDGVSFLLLEDGSYFLQE